MILNLWHLQKCHSTTVATSYQSKCDFCMNNDLNRDLQHFKYYTSDFWLMKMPVYSLFSPICCSCSSSCAVLLCSTQDLNTSCSLILCRQSRWPSCLWSSRISQRRTITWQWHWQWRIQSLEEPSIWFKYLIHWSRSNWRINDLIFYLTKWYLYH